MSVDLALERILKSLNESYKSNNDNPSDCLNIIILNTLLNGFQLVVKKDRVTLFRKISLVIHPDKANKFNKNLNQYDSLKNYLSNDLNKTNLFDKVSNVAALLGKLNNFITFINFLKFFINTEYFFKKNHEFILDMLKDKGEILKNTILNELYETLGLEDYERYYQPMRTIVYIIGISINIATVLILVATLTIKPPLYFLSWVESILLNFMSNNEYDNVVIKYFDNNFSEYSFNHDKFNHDKLELCKKIVFQTKLIYHVLYSLFISSPLPETWVNKFISIVCRLCILPLAITLLLTVAMQDCLITLVNLTLATEIISLFTINLMLNLPLYIVEGMVSLCSYTHSEKSTNQLTNSQHRMFNANPENVTENGSDNVTENGSDNAITKEKIPCSYSMNDID